MGSMVAASPSDVAHDSATLHFYAEHATAYAASARHGPSRRLDDFVKRLAPEARILELGCGDGRDSEAMLARGFDVDPTDGSEAMARQAEARLGRPVRVMRFDGLVAMEAYDAIWAHACLLHAPRSTLSDVLNAIFRALKPGGLHVATFKAGGVEGRDALGRYFNYLSAAWEILAIQGYQGGDYQGGARPWIAITVRKPS